MKEYIEKAVALEALSKSGVTCNMRAHKIVASIQAADVAPVVRCRECKRWDADPDSYGKDDGPKGKRLKTFEETYPDDFCSYGQRKIETILPKSDAKDESLEGDQ